MDAVHRLNGDGVKALRYSRSAGESQIPRGSPAAGARAWNIQYIDWYWGNRCTHRPSLLPIGWLSEDSGLAPDSRQLQLGAGNGFKLGHLEEVKVVTRSP